MTIKQCLYFRYGQIDSTTFNIINCTIDSGMYSEPFLPQRTVIEQKIRGRSYLQEIQEENLKFNLTFAFQDSWTDDDLRAICRWFSADYFQPLVFYESMTPTGSELIYYALFVDASELVHNGRRQGYIQLPVYCNAPHGFTHAYQSSIYECRTTQTAFVLPFSPTTYTTPITIKIENNGDKPTQPLIYVKSYTDNFTITNLTNGGQKMSFTGLNINETLEIDCENEDITTDIPDTYRYDNMDGDFLELVRGVNTLLVEGNVDIQMKFEMKRYQ